MATRGGIGETPLDRLREHYERTRMRCSACGYEDSDGRWDAGTTGSEIAYEHVCPSCGYSDRIVIRPTRD